jgi:hypothetical protein
LRAAAFFLCDARFRLVDVLSHALDVVALYRPVRQCGRGPLLMVGHAARSLWIVEVNARLPYSRYAGHTPLRGGLPPALA